MIQSTIQSQPSAADGESAPCSTPLLLPSLSLSFCLSRVAPTSPTGLSRRVLAESLLRCHTVLDELLREVALADTVHQGLSKGDQIAKFGRQLLKEPFVPHVNTVDAVDMRFCDPLRNILAERLQQNLPKSFAMVGPSGCGKTTSIFHYAKTHWVVYFAFEDPPWDLRLQSMYSAVEDISGAWSDFSSECKPTEPDRRLILRDIFAQHILARLVLMLKMMEAGRKPLDFFLYQMNGGQTILSSMSERLDALRTEHSGMFVARFRQALLARVDTHLEKSGQKRPLIALDEAQEFSKLAVEKLYSDKLKRPVSAISELARHVLKYSLNTVFCGTAFSLRVIENNLSNLAGKDSTHGNDRDVYITEFKPLAFDDVVRWINQHVNIPEDNLAFLKAFCPLRARLVSTLVRTALEDEKFRQVHADGDGESARTTLKRLFDQVIKDERAVLVPKTKTKLVGLCESKGRQDDVIPRRLSLSLCPPRCSLVSSAFHCLRVVATLLLHLCCASKPSDSRGCEQTKMP